MECDITRCDQPLKGYQENLWKTKLLVRSARLSAHTQKTELAPTSLAYHNFIIFLSVIRIWYFIIKVKVKKDHKGIFLNHIIIQIAKKVLPTYKVDLSESESILSGTKLIICCKMKHMFVIIDKLFFSCFIKNCPLLIKFA